jgi:hypothetical protein
MGKFSDGTYFEYDRALETVLSHFPYSKVGLTSVESTKRIAVGAGVGRHPALASNGAAEDPRKTIIRGSSWAQYMCSSSRC